MEEEATIAVVGIGCMFPGAENIDEFWKILCNGEDHVQDIPPERFNVDAFYDPDPDNPRKTYVRKAGLVKSYDEWDNKFFGISDLEAEIVDPQQHFVLETVHMALEDGGFTQEKLDSSDTGVYIGALNRDWGSLLRISHERSRNTTVTSVDNSILSARVAYFYNLLGPAMTINTACSSSMVAIDTASQALKNGKISTAICGGVNVILDPDTFINLSCARMASPTGKCHTFSSKADGYARGEGCGVVVLKRLADAIHDKNKIWGTIHTMLNQDGHMSTPITSPSGKQQEHLLEKIFKESKTSPSSVQYIEAHGTGTPVGDYIEVSSLGSFFSKYCEEEIPIGSVKTNIGHLEAGAGMASLIKVLLMMKYGHFVPSLHAETLNPKIPFSACKMKVSRSLQKWPANSEGKRIASINCFGFGGTNSHAIVRNYEETGSSSVQLQYMESCLNMAFYVLLSAKDLSALYDTAKHLLEFLLDDMDTISLIDLSSTTVHFRSHYRFRKVFVVENTSKLISEIDEFVHKKLPIPGALKERPKIIFVYCGVGTTWVKMCKQLITQDKVFEKTIIEIDKHLSSFTDISVRTIFETEEDISDPLKNHLSIFACQVGLTAMWEHLGVNPTAIIGQSVGEVAGAYASGNLTLKNAVRVIYFRSLNLASETFGKMVLIQHCPVEVIEETCENLVAGKANVAVYHSSVSCAVSGDKEAIEELKLKLADKSAKITHLNVKCAYHSHLTKNASKRLEQILSGIEKKIPRTTVISTVTGQIADENFGSNSYWADNVFKPVRFQHALEEAKRRAPNSIFLEIGPSPVLRAHLSSIFPDSVEEALPSMKRDKEIDVFRETFINLFGKGIPVSWEKIVPMQKFLSCPKYQFSKRKYLVKSEKIKSILNGDTEDESTLLTRTRIGNNEQFTITLSRKNTPFIYDHTLDGNIVVPAAMYGDVALEIGTMLLQSRGVTEMDISWDIHRTLLVKDTEQNIVVKALEKEKTIYFEAISSESQSVLSSGTIKQSTTSGITTLNIERLISLLHNEKETTNVYPTLRSLGFHHGALYQTIKKCVCRGVECISEINLSDEVMTNLNRAFFHPIIIDSMFQSCCGIHFQKKDKVKARTLPSRVSRLTVKQKPCARMICYTVLVYENSVTATFNILLLHTNGSIIAKISNYEVTKVALESDIFSLSYSETWNAITLPQLRDLDRKKLYLLSWNKEYLSLLENAFSKRFRTSEVRCLALSDNFEHQLSVFLEEEVDTQQFDIIYIPGLPEIKTQTTGDELMNSVKQTAHCFLELVKILYNNKVHILVITNKTQACQSIKTGIIGAELWGMVRSVSQEGTQLSFTLLDIEDLTEQSMDYIIRIITEMDPGNTFAPSDYAVRQNIIYKNELKRMSDEFHSTVYKSTFPKETDKVCFRYHGDKSELSYFAIPCDEDSVDLEFCCIKPKQALPCIHDTFFIQDNLTPERYCSENKIKGFGITVCEVVGTAEVDGRELEVIAFGQMELRSEIRVDKRCVFQKSELTGYSLGSLHAAIIAIAIADLVKHKSDVFIDFSEKYSLIYHFLFSALLEKKCVISSCETAYSKKTQNIKAVQLVVLSEEGYDDPHMFRVLFPSVRTCISLKGAMPSSFIDQTLCNFHVINVVDLFRSNCMEVTSLRERLLTTLRCNKKIDSPTPSLLDIDKLSDKMELRIPDEFLIRTDSAYIVVGGLTGLGWLIVKYLCRRGAKMIVSLSRRSLSSENKKRIQNIKFLHGVSVVHREVDLNELEHLKQVMYTIQQQMPNIPIRGVFQGAAELKDQTVLKMTVETFDIPLMVKIKGTWNLHLATKEMNLDFFVLHSSVASTFGSHSQSNYAAANAFLDSFSHYRRSLGLPAQVINWGALDVGLGSDPSLKDFFLHKGINLMSVSQIYSVLTQMLLSDHTQGIFVDFDLKKFLTASSKRWEKSKFTNLISFADRSIFEENDDEKSSYESIQNFVDLVKKTSSQILMVEISEIADTHSLTRFGLDSQNAVEITNIIFSETKVRIPIVLILSGELSVLEIAKFLREKEMLSRESSDLSGENQSLSKTMSVVEKQLKSVHDIHKELSFVATYAISNSRNQPNFWEKVFQIFFRMNPNLRVQSTENYLCLQDSNNTVDCEDFTFPFEFVKTRSVSGSLLQNVEVLVSMIYEDIDNKPQLHINCNRVGLDVFCAKIIQNDLQRIVSHVLASQPVPPWFDKPHIDIVNVYANKLHEIAEKSRTFWKNHLRLCSTSDSCISYTNGFELENTKKEIEIPKALIEFAKKHDLSMFIIVCSAFQIVLNKLTNAGRVSLLTEIDLRSELPECQDVILPCANLIPLASPSFEDSFARVCDMLVENKAVVNQCMNHCLFPFVEIKDLMEFDRKTHMKHYFLFDSLENVNNQCIQLKSLEVNTNMDYETGLYAKHNLAQNTLELEFQFCSGFVSSVNTPSVVNFVSDFIQTLPEKYYQTLHQLKLPTWSEKSPALFPKGNILFIKNDGKKEQVFLELSEHPPNLTWGSELDKQIGLSDIDEFHIFHVDGHSCLRLQLNGGRKDVNLEESDNQSFQTLVSFLKSQLLSDETK
ncbi:uncharacterized protein LOC133192336 [Saccostrea echinata]|uniref:uncharacterized protein LOC133192336 n=1 Tax=Saccostrea echinata TaxID=191078 RepID=UPI002A8077BC|nr:uncharacterized protein LOC133192336 [Saccostrea echinata]